ncbi:hypothetical protein SETIT_8G135200v2 [Setaria italica]|uniref:Uncharacterized protein n=1 Tax=Setaria italica TaxID=4555 RepID=A0A368S7D6_SETIT|nr:hypothetical protein SETIT_8G135200v2 [Setaria italica]
MKHKLRIGGIWNSVTSPHVSSRESSSSRCGLISIDLIGALSRLVGEVCWTNACRA